MFLSKKTLIMLIFIYIKKKNLITTFYLSQKVTLEKNIIIYTLTWHTNITKHKNFNAKIFNSFQNKYLIDK